MEHPGKASTFARLPMFAFIAWRNIWRYPIRSLLTISALAGGLIMVILYSTLLEGMTRQMVEYATETSTGHIQVHRQAFIDDRDMYATLPWEYLEALRRDFPDLNMAPRLYAAGLASAEQSSTGVMITAVSPQQELNVTNMLSKIKQGEVRLGVADESKEGFPRYHVVIGSQLSKNLKVGPGDELVLVTQAADGSIGNGLYRVAAVLSPIEPNFDRMGVLMSIDAYQQLMYLESGFHELAINLDDIDQQAIVQQALTQKIQTLTQQQPLDELGGQPVVRNWREINPAISDMLELSHSIILVIGLIIVGLASLGMLNTMLMAVHERTHEFGILLAIGMKRRWLLTMVLFESFFLALVSALVGSAIGAWIGYRIQVHGIDFSGTMPEGYDWAGMSFEPIMKGYLMPEHILNASLMMLVVAMISSLLPSWRTVRMKPAEVMR